MTVQHKKNPAHTRLIDKYTKYLLLSVFCRKLRFKFLSQMKKLFALVALFTLMSCSKNDRVNSCNFIPDVGVNRAINMNLPEYSQLQFTSNSVVVDNEGLNGVIIINVGNNSFRAWEATDPNHAPTSACSRLTITGANATCGCPDANTYSLFTGQSIGVNLPCGLKEYRVESAGNNTVVIRN